MKNVQLHMARTLYILQSANRSVFVFVERQSPVLVVAAKIGDVMSI